MASDYHIGQRTFHLYGAIWGREGTRLPGLQFIQFHSKHLIPASPILGAGERKNSMVLDPRNSKHTVNNITEQYRLPCLQPNGVSELRSKGTVY
jgi:hypothetical protein